MRVVNNNQGILQFFSRMNGNRANTNKPFGNTALSRRSSAGGRNTLEDFLSGHRKTPMVWRECVSQEEVITKKLFRYRMR